MRNIKIVIEYDGTHYSGWQRQKNSIAVQQCVEKAISEITHENIITHGASRTDAGVHAKGQVASFLTERTIPVDKFVQAINSKLPSDIAILSAEEMPEDFHPRYNTKGKRYSYTIFNRFIRPAYMKDYAAHCPYELDFDAMKRAARHFIGKHDFSAFRSTGSSVKTSVRTVNMLELEKDGFFIVMHIEADGFLYNMVRIIAGTLMQVGLGKIDEGDIPSIIVSGDRTKAGKTAPACGLCLEKVYY